MAAQELTKTVLKDNANLKAYYRFESGALETDSSGNAVTLTNTGTVTAGTGVYGGAADLGASNSTKSLTSTNTLSINGGAITMCGWFKLNTEIGSSTQILLGHLNNTTATYERIVYDYNGGTRRLLFYRTKPGVADQGPSYTVTLGTSNWVHLAFTYDATNVRGFVNGACIGTVAASGNGTGSYTQGIFIGQDQSGGNQPSALIDDVAFFNVALSADQIKELYEGRFIGEAYPQAGLVAGYHLSSETDFSGNNYHLTNNGTTTFVAGKFGNAATQGTSNSTKFFNLDQAIVNLTSGGVSISCWVKLNTEIGSGTYEFVHIENNTQKHVMYMMYEYNGGTRRLHFSQARWVVYGWDAYYTITLGTSNWYHLVLAKDTGGYIRIYVNGNYVALSSAPDYAVGNTAVNNQLLIGCGSTEGTATKTKHSSAQIDEALIFNRELTPQEIRRMYAQGTGKLQ